MTKRSIRNIPAPSAAYDVKKSQQRVKIMMLRGGGVNSKSSLDNYVVFS